MHKKPRTQVGSTSTAERQGRCYYPILAAQSTASQQLQRSFTDQLRAFCQGRLDRGAGPGSVGGPRRCTNLDSALVAGLIRARQGHAAGRPSAFSPASSPCNAAANVEPSRIVHLPTTTAGCGWLPDLYATDLVGHPGSHTPAIEPRVRRLHRRANLSCSTQQRSSVDAVACMKTRRAHAQARARTCSYAARGLHAPPQFLLPGHSFHAAWSKDQLDAEPDLTIPRPLPAARRPRWLQPVLPINPLSQPARVAYGSYWP